MNAKRPTVVFVGMNSPEHQAQCIGALGGSCCMKFPESLNGARKLLKEADVVAIPIEDGSELFVADICKKGYEGHIVPFVVSRNKQRMRIPVPGGTPAGTIKDGVSRRDIPKIIHDILFVVVQPATV